jgi:hypothetical protein
VSSRIREHFRSNIVGYIAIFLFAISGTAYATHTGGANTISSGDIQNNQVFSADVRDDTLAGGGLVSADVRNDTQTSPAGGLAAPDLRPNAVGTSEVANGTLNDEDIGQGTFSFTGIIGIVQAHSCDVGTVGGVNAQGDHLLLTPNSETAAAGLVYSAENRNTDGNWVLKVCNPTASNIDDGNTNFRLLWIDAQ